MANEIISYIEMCRREGASLQRGMNFGIGGTHSVILMSEEFGYSSSGQLLAIGISVQKTSQNVHNMLVDHYGCQRSAENETL
jgi:hypothetical protein